jgi:hypothetical protein
MTDRIEGTGATAVVVWENTPGATPVLVALCDEHLVLLPRCSCATLVERIGRSHVLGCEACPLIASGPFAAWRAA